MVAGPPADFEVSSSPAGGEVSGVVIVTAEGDARVNEDSEPVSPTGNSEEHVTGLSSPGMCSITHPPLHVDMMLGGNEDLVSEEHLCGYLFVWVFIYS